MVCDICNVSGSGTLLTAAQVRGAVSNGFNPVATGFVAGSSMIRDLARRHERWLLLVQQNETAWNLCARCFAEIQPYLSGTRQSGDLGAPNSRSQGGESDHPTEHTSLAWVIFCPVVGAISGVFLTGIASAIITAILGIKNWDVTSSPLAKWVAIGGAALGATAFFLGNLSAYRSERGLAGKSQRDKSAYKTSLMWLILCPIPGAIVGVFFAGFVDVFALFISHIIASLLGNKDWVFWDPWGRCITAAGIVIGALAMFVSVLKEYRRERGL